MCADSTCLNHFYRSPNFIKIARLIIAIFGVATLGGCAIDGSHGYKPLPNYEAAYFEKANRNVFPRDIIKDPTRGATTMVAWAGIIRKIALDEKDPIVRFEIEHRFFDWIEDSGEQQAKFFLSSRGEGRFAVAWGAATADEQSFIDQFAVGDMIIAYGNPSVIHKGVIGFFPTYSIRGVKPQFFRTDVAEYGRPGEPIITRNRAF